MINHMTVEKGKKPVECEEPGTILHDYSDLSTSHWDRWPATAQLIQRIMKALGMANLFPLSLFEFCIVHVWQKD